MRPSHAASQGPTVFLAPEGNYRLVEQFYLESAIPNPNIGTRVSLVTVKSRDDRATLEGESSGEQSAGSSLRTDGESAEVDLGGTTTTNVDSQATDTESQTHVSSEQSSTPSIVSIFSNSSKRKKPKSNVAKTNSSFVARTQPGEVQVSAMHQDTFIFFNIGKTFYWSGLNVQAKENAIAQINFNKAYPTCHHVNLMTRDSHHLDVIIGFNTGDIVWFDPMSHRYNRLNKQGVVNASAVTAIQWMPGSENLFMVAFKDGSMAVFDRDKDDQPVSLQSPERNVKFQVIRAPKGSKHNPTSYWQVSPSAITAFAISPDCQHIAIVSMDGCLRVVDLIEEKLMDTYQSYFGGLCCVAWSPDGKYILTGGQDDLVSVWSFAEQSIVARCQGHQSWVTGVAFDDWRCDQDMYRFGSVGEDGRLLLWDFSAQTVCRRPRYATMSRDSVSLKKRNSSVTLASRKVPMVHAALPRHQVPILQPIVSILVHSDPLTSIIFQEKYLVMACCRGRIKLWERPLEEQHH